VPVLLTFYSRLGAFSLQGSVLFKIQCFRLKAIPSSTYGLSSTYLRLFLVIKVDSVRNYSSWVIQLCCGSNSTFDADIPFDPSYCMRHGSVN